MITIKTATLDDVPAIAELFDGYRQFYKQSSDLNAAHAFIEARLKNHESVIFYAQTDSGEPLGFTQLYPTFSSVSVSKRWILNDLYVSPTARNQGVGHLLMEAAKQFAENDGAGTVQLSASVGNTGAQKLYESLGYQKITNFYYYSLSLTS